MVTIFVVALDEIWLMQNDALFHNTMLNINAENLALSIYVHASQIKNAFFEVSPSFPRNPLNHNFSNIHWVSPSEGTLNCDGVVYAGRQASYGGVLRIILDPLFLPPLVIQVCLTDHFRSFVSTSICNLGSCFVLESELWAIYHGLKLI